MERRQDELYSDNFEKYTGEYWKREYDIKLLNGNVVTNCYPNAGFFQSLRNDIDSSIAEAFVAEIRFSNEPITDLNIEVSKHLPEYVKQQEIEEGIVDSKDEIQTIRRKRVGAAIASYPLMLNPEISAMSSVMDAMMKRDMAKIPRADRGRKHEPIRDSKENPKIQRNDKCPCGSGKKYKHCCINVDAVV